MLKSETAQQADQAIVDQMVERMKNGDIASDYVEPNLSNDLITPPLQMLVASH